MKLCLTLLSLLFIAASPAREASISSDHADFINDLLTLEGNVCIDHPLGTFKAEKATVQKASEDAENKLAFATFEDGVSIEFSEHQGIHCDTANFDFSLLEATLTSEGNANDVTITDVWPSKNGLLPLVLKAKNIHCKMNNQKKKQLQFNALSATNTAVFSIGDLYEITADHIKYTADTTIGKNDRAILPKGIIHFFAASATEPCKIKTNTETFFAEHIVYNLETHTFAIDALKGNLQQSIMGDKTVECSIEATKTLFDVDNGHITFSEGVTISPNDIGNVATSHLVEVFINQNHAIEKILATRDTKIDLNAGITLFCPEATSVMPMSHIITSQATDQSNPIAFTHEDLSVSCNFMQMEYTTTEATLPISHLSLEQEVRLHSNSPLIPLQYAAANALVFDGQRNRFVIKGSDSKPAFFYNDNNCLKMSAETLTISTNEETNKSEIKGEGAVYFSFPLEEKHIFHELLHDHGNKVAL